MALALLCALGGMVTGHVALPHRKSAPVLNQRYEVVARGGILATNPPLAVVYIEGPFPPPGPAPTAQMAQQDLEFMPTLLPVRAGTRVFFPNRDDTYHNVFSYSPAKRFDLGRYRSDERPIPSIVFDQPGLVTLHCDIHEHMRALILVLDTPYFAVTSPDGAFKLERVPPGRHWIKAWLDSRTTLEKPLDVREGQAVQADFP